MSILSGGATFPSLFRPGQIGRMAVRNRLAMCPMAEGLANRDGSVSDAQVAYFAARADGGVGLVIVGSCVVAYPQAAFAPNMTALSHPRYLPGLRRLTARVQAAGARIAAQLVHDGQYALEDVAAGRPLLVPSPPRGAAPDRLALMASPEEIAARIAPFQAPGARLEHREATEDDLAWVIERFATAAGLARDAGFDGVELHAGHGYLIDSFLSAASNRRHDLWGGSLKNRARLLLQIIAAVRRRVGADFPLWCRLNAFERHVEGGETLDDAVAVARLAAAAGLDAIHVTANANAALGIAPIVSHTPHAPAALIDHAATIRQAVTAPVIAFGRLAPRDAEQALVEGKADFIAMGRKLLADPNLPNKLARGATQEIRPCIYHYRCLGNLYLRGHVACTTNPATGAERPPIVLHHRRRVLVVGGGVAGLEAARLLATAGAEVILTERADAPGGQLRLAAAADPDLAPLLDWLIGEASRLPIELRLGQEASARLIADCAPDDIVVATGSRWARPALPGGDRENVCTVDDPFWRQAAGGATRVVLGGGKAGLSAAACMAAQGARVLVLEPGHLFAAELGPPGRAYWVDHLERAGVRLVEGARVTAISDAGIHWSGADGGAESCAADLIIAAQETVPVSFETAAGPRVFRVGECAGERNIEGALKGAADLVARLATR